MYKLLSMAAACAVLGFVSLTSQAAIVGPDYPPPGGVTWINTEGISGADGTATWDYSNFDVTGLTGLYFGLDQINHGPAGAGLDSSLTAFNFVSAAGQTATWTASTNWDDPGVPGTGTTPATTQLQMTITGLGANPWITDLASLGLDDTGTFGILGAVADISTGLDFTLMWSIMADTGSGYNPINSVQQPAPGGQTRSSFATGFYSVAEVPLPAAAWLFLSAIGGLGIIKRKRR